MGSENLLNSTEFTPSEQQSLEDITKAAEPGSLAEKKSVTKLLGDFLDLALRNISANEEQARRGVERIAPSQVEQKNRGVEALQQIEGIKPEVWEKLSLQERVTVLQTVESVMAEAQERPELQIVAEKMPPNSFGRFNGRAIYINELHLSNNEVAEHVDTIIHEGRHAYQLYAIEHPGYHSDNLDVLAWRENFAEYKTVQKHGARAYSTQPVEVDARAYASALRQILYSNVRGS